MSLFIGAFVWRKIRIRTYRKNWKISISITDSYVEDMCACRAYKTGLVVDCSRVHCCKEFLSILAQACWMKEIMQQAPKIYHDPQPKIIYSLKFRNPLAPGLSHGCPVYLLAVEPLAIFKCVQEKKARESFRPAKPESESTHEAGSSCRSESRRLQVPLVV